jgi:hypothetical protein
MPQHSFVSSKDVAYPKCTKSLAHSFNPLPLLFKSLLPGQENCVFLSGHLNLHAKPETGIP